MTTTKIIIAIAAIAALALTVVGVAAAQIVQNQNQLYTNTAPNTQAPNNGFWGWIGDCFGYRAAQGYEAQPVAPPTGVNTTAPAPYQGGYGPNYGYGYGPCWAGW